MKKARVLLGISLAIVMTTTLGTAVPAMSAPCPDGSFELSGTVYSDINGLPLTEITSVGIESTDGTYADGEGTQLPGSTYTTCVPPGEYLVSFFADSFMFEYYDDSFDAVGATPVTITDAAVAGVDASLGWATITGRMTDRKTGAPLLFASASVTNADTAVGFDDNPADDAGVYTLQVPPGRWVVAFTADYFWAEWYDNAKRLSRAEVIEVTPFTPLISDIDGELKRCSRTVPDFCFPRNFRR
jgi:hypothetical protein